MGLVGGIPTPLNNMKVNFQCMEKQNVPNHQLGINKGNNSGLTMGE